MDFICHRKSLIRVRTALVLSSYLVERFGSFAQDATAEVRLKLKTAKQSRVRLSVPKWLAAKTFRVEYSPNCANPWLIRLVGYGQGHIDGRPYAPMGLGTLKPTGDALGFGATFALAANNALKHWENQKRLAQERFESQAKGRLVRS